MASSQDPNQISLTIKSIGIAFIPLFIFIGKAIGYEFIESDLIQIINSVATMAAMIGIIYGVARKYKKKK